MKIRQSVFETNSSSSHSLTIGSGNIMPNPFTKDEVEQGYVEIEAAEFNWEFEDYYDIDTKLSYLMAFLSMGHSGDLNEITDDTYINMLRKVIKGYTGLDVKFLKNTDAPSSFDYGYIDHQSTDVPRWAFEDEQTLHNFLFSNNSYFSTGNDNV